MESSSDTASLENISAEWAGVGIMSEAAQLGVKFHVKNTFLEFNALDMERALQSDSRFDKSQRSRSQPATPTAYSSKYAVSAAVATSALAARSTYGGANGLQELLCKTPASSTQRQDFSFLPSFAGKVDRAIDEAGASMFYALSSPGGRHHCMSGIPGHKKNRRRPCKGQRVRYRKQASRLEELVSLAPETFDPTSLELPPSIEGNSALKQKLLARLEMYKVNALACKADGTDHQRQLQTWPQH